MRVTPLGCTVPQVMDQGVDLGGRHVGVALEIEEGIETPVRRAALRPAEADEVHQRVHAGVEHVRPLPEVPPGVEQRVRVAAFLPAVADPMGERRHVLLGDVWIGAPVVVGVEQPAAGDSQRVLQQPPFPVAGMRRPPGDLQDQLEALWPAIPRSRCALTLAAASAGEAREPAERQRLGEGDHIGVRLLGRCELLVDLPCPLLGGVGAACLPIQVPVAEREFLFMVALVVRPG